MNKKKKALFIALLYVSANLLSLNQPAVAVTASVPSVSSPTEVAMELSASEVVDWVCKVLITVVAVSAWTYAVVRTGGILLVISKEIIKYVTVPSIVCEWL